MPHVLDRALAFGFLNAPYGMRSLAKVQGHSGT